MKQTQEKQKGTALTMEQSDQPTYTFHTPKAIAFYVSSVITTVSMFLNWFKMDLNLGIAYLEDVFGKVNVFTMPGAIGDAKEMLSVFGSLLPNDVTSALGTLQIACYALLVCAVAAIVMYAIASYLRIKQKKETDRMGKIASGLVLVTALGFVAVLIGCLNGIGAAEVAGSVMGSIVKSPWLFSVIGAIVTFVCSPLDKCYKEDVVVYHNGILKISNSPRWRCDCGRENLGRLESCCYCGKVRGH